MSALPEIREFLAGFVSRSGWGEAMKERLDAVCEETLLTLVDRQGDGAPSGRQRLLLAARKEEGCAVLEFVTASGDDNVEDRIALLGNDVAEPPAERGDLAQASPAPRILGPPRAVSRRGVHHGARGKRRIDAHPGKTERRDDCRTRDCEASHGRSSDSAGRSQPFPLGTGATFRADTKMRQSQASRPASCIQRTQENLLAQHLPASVLETPLDVAQECHFLSAHAAVLPGQQAQTALSPSTWKSCQSAHGLMAVSCLPEPACGNGR